MEKIFLTGVLSIFIFSFSSSIYADKYVKGYTKSNGTYVQGYYRSSPDAVRSNNINSQSNGGSQRDEYSSGLGATNKKNSSYNYRDNDNDGISNRYDKTPNAKCSGYYCN
ncbi:MULTISPECIES: hypothetical protein [Cycloclasticus]|jgi:hypothetical protein|uniref:Uncharacterized protein n=1 Tax=Cycloclasticus pugetii TaxID=34068 RepID=A0AB33YYP1_9GAMM|nr:MULTISPECIES: hypothetical protein [Cycloclasticus]ATI04049.1 hypothetical protein CPC19_11415 [Cycloclasticus sp. PY97N]EPD12270.1 hypothetical protein L196_10709 [Cycloclasticus pugetii]